MTATLKPGRVPGFINSLRQEETGEVLTGPGKPRPWDPGSLRWTAPALVRQGGQPLGTEAWPAVPLDFSVADDGSVLDVRYARPDTQQAAEIQAAVKSWWFTPARYEGRPVKSRVSMDSRGGAPGPSAVPGTPRQPGEGIVPPATAVPVLLPPGAKPPPKEPLLRLVVDEAGQVADVTLEISCGDPALDEAALAAARKMAFAPALLGKDPVPVYLNLQVKFVETPSP
jgi:TonB family protein